MPTMAIAEGHIDILRFAEQDLVVVRYQRAERGDTEFEAIMEEGDSFSSTKRGPEGPAGNGTPPEEKKPRKASGEPQPSNPPT